MDNASDERAGRRPRIPLQRSLRRLDALIREGDEQMIEDALVQFIRRRRGLAPLALAVTAIMILFRAVRVVAANWRLMLVQVLPAMLIWAASLDLKAHVFRGKQFSIVHGPLLVVIFTAVVLLTIAAFFLNSAFAFAISQQGPPVLRTAFKQAREHELTVACWGTGTGLALAVAVVLAPRWGLGWFALLLGIVLAFMMVCYVAVPAAIAGVPTAKTAKTKQSGRDKVVMGAVTGVFGVIVCAPAYVLVRIGLALLGSLFGLGLALLIVGLMLQAGATGAVKAVKISAKLLVHQSSPASAGRSSSASSSPPPLPPSLPPSSPPGPASPLANLGER